MLPRPLHWSQTGSRLGTFMDTAFDPRYASQRALRCPVSCYSQLVRKNDNERATVSLMCYSTLHAILVPYAKVIR